MNDLNNKPHHRPSSPEPGRCPKQFHREPRLSCDARPENHRHPCRPLRPCESGAVACACVWPKSSPSGKEAGNRAHVSLVACDPRSAHPFIFSVTAVRAPRAQVFFNVRLKFIAVRNRHARPSGRNVTTAPLSLFPRQSRADPRPPCSARFLQRIRLGLCFLAGHRKTSQATRTRSRQSSHTEPFVWLLSPAFSRLAVGLAPERPLPGEFCGNCQRNKHETVRHANGQFPFHKTETAEELHTLTMCRRVEGGRVCPGKACWWRRGASIELGTPVRTRT